ncbi:MAG TPA: hypothetical protein VLT45_17425, partial [Kofleriaceae bacterium]|nr:hypothetical protein [Kofleriaceae bacterium]
MKAHWLVALLAGACHGGSSPVTPDGAVPIDGAVTADAPADAPPAAAFAFDPPMLDFGYVESNTVSAPLRLTVLNNNSVAIPQFALVLSGDDTIDLQIS